MRLLYANSSPADVLLKAELEAFAREHDNFSVWFTGVISGFDDLTPQPPRSVGKGSTTDIALKLRAFPAEYLQTQCRSMSVVRTPTRPV